MSKGTYKTTSTNVITNQSSPNHMSPNKKTSTENGPVITNSQSGGYTLTHVQKRNDSVFVFAYALCFAAFIATSIYYFPARRFLEPVINFAEFQGIWLFSILTCLSITALVSIGFAMLSTIMPKITIYASFVFTAAFFATMLVLAAVAEQLAGCIFGALGLLLFVVYFAFVRKYIPFTCQLLQSTRPVLGGRKGIFAVVAAALFLSLGFCSVAGWSFIGIHLHRKGLPSGIFYGSLIFDAFFTYWTLNLVISMCHLIISGVFAEWYLKPSHNCKNPVWNAACRSVWFSFGSVALGSLFVAVIQTIRMVLQRTRAASRSASRGVHFSHILSSLLDCLLTGVEKAVKLFNHYAYVLIAIRGCSFMEAARNALQLFKDRGMSLVINMDIVSHVIVLGIVLANGIAQLITLFAFSIHSKTDQFIETYLAVSVPVGILISSLICSVIKSGTSTALVCYAIDPECLLNKENSEIRNAKLAIDEKILSCAS